MPPRHEDRYREPAKPADPVGTLLRLLSRLGGDRRRFAWIVPCQLAATAASLAWPRVLGLATDDIASGAFSWTRLSALLLGGFAATLAGCAAQAAIGRATAAIPADVPAPVISDVKFLEGGAVQIKVENVVPYVQYTVSGGKTPTASDQKDIATGLSRQAGSVTLTVANPGENRFFKVVNK